VLPHSTLRLQNHRVPPCKRTAKYKNILPESKSLVVLMPKSNYT
jgi:hypothetical protein